MGELLALMLACAAGALLGTTFFGGLWWTVRKGVSSERPALWFVSSWLVRTGIALLGFYFVANGHWDRLVACLIGFAIAHLAITHLPSPEARHAP